MKARYRSAIVVAVVLLLGALNGSPLGSPLRPAAILADEGYKLPWTANTAWGVTQGWGGSYSHNGTQMYYGYDFNMNEGTPVRAVKAGTVAFAKTNVPASSCGGQSQANNANYVTLYHNDGSATLYLHLSSVVRSSGAVNQGEVIGYSGKTGWTGCGPHLHFQRQAQGGWITNSRPIYFDEYPGQQLTTSGSYTSQNSGSTPPPECNGDGVVLYDGQNYGGDCQAYTYPGNDNSCISLGGMSDRSESIKFSGNHVGGQSPGQYEAVLYGDNSCAVYNARYDSARTTFEGLNNQFSSMRIERKTAPPTGCNADGIVLYDGQNYGGDCQTYTYPGNDNTCIDLGGMSNRAESLKFSGNHVGGQSPGQYEAVLYGDSGCSVYNARYDSARTTFEGLNNEFSSMRIERKTAPQPPAAPSLSSPSNGANFGQGQAITLCWTATGNEYFGEITGGPGGMLTFGWQGGTCKDIGTQWAGYTYSWKVKARNSGGESGWSSTWTFTVQSRPLETRDPGRWFGQYYENEYLSGSPAVAINEDTLDREWLGGSPGWGLPVDHFSTRYQRRVNLPCGTYRFLFSHDDGGRLFIDGTQRYQQWAQGRWNDAPVEVALTAGDHELLVEQYEIDGWAQLKLNWTRIGDGGCTGWGAWAGPLGGIVGSPAIVAHDGQLVAAARGLDGQLWVRWYDGGTAWGNWYGPLGAIADAPALASVGGRLYIAVRGMDGQLWVRWYDGGTAWSGWTGPHGGIQGAPAAAGHNGTLRVAVRGMDGQLWARGFNGATWSGWSGPLGGISASPALASYGGALHVAVRGMDGNLWLRADDGSGWSPWTVPLGGISDAPALTSARGQLTLAVRGLDGQLWTRAFDGAAWGAWSGPLGGIVGSPAASGRDGTLYVAVVGLDGNLWSRRTLP